MIKLVLIVLSFFISLIHTYGQQKHCGNGRYVYDLFEVEEFTTTLFGKNTTIGGNEQELYMDIFVPKDDKATERPVIIFVFGGSFVGGERSQVHPMCKFYARKGFVTAAIDYRLYDGQGVPDSIGIMDVAIKAMGDVKASVRFFRKDASNENKYKIDKNFIIASGLSSGAIACLHATYMDNEDNIPDFIEDIIKNNGGFEGNSGDDDNLKHSSRIDAVINYFGGIYTKNWIGKNDVPIISIHGDEDDVVSYGDGKASVKIGGVELASVSISGSKSIHNKAEDLSILNFLITVPGGGHGDFMKDQIWVDSMYSRSTNFIHNKVLCPDFVGINNPATNRSDINVYPNPSFGNVSIKSNGKKPVEIYILDSYGREIYKEVIGSSESKINLSQYGRGVYLIKYKIINQPQYYGFDRIIIN